MRCRLPSRRSRKVVQVEDNAKKKRSFFHLALLRRSLRYSRLVQVEANTSPPYLYISTNCIYLSPKTSATSLNLILGFEMMVSSSETLIAGFAMMVSNHEINFMVITGENARCPCPMRPMSVGLSLSSDAAEGCGSTKTMAADKKKANLFLSPRGLYYFCGSYRDAARLLPLQRVRFRAPWRDGGGGGKSFLMVKKGKYVQGNGCGCI